MPPTVAARGAPNASIILRDEARTTSGKEAIPAGRLTLDEQPIAREVFDRLADAYAARIETKAHNAFYDRPAMTSLLPPVEGKRVLDAGCGPGVYTEWLVTRGAEVVGIDVSHRMVELAGERLGDKAVVHCRDLGRPLDFLADSSFDLVISALALDYVRDWLPVFREFFRVLRDGGRFVFSVGHPFDEFFDHHPGGNYFDLEPVDYEWRGFGSAVRVPYYRRSLSAMLDPLLEAGFVLERLLEPRPVAEFQDHDPADYDKLMRRPGFICFRARKEAAPAGRPGQPNRSAAGSLHSRGM
jgi:SAM-dependent methyltransferase